MIEASRTPDERFDDLPGYGFEPHYVELDGLRMHFVDEGDGDGPPILFLHGEPTWSYLYRTMVTGLSGAGRRVAPDLFGFGRSDKPTDRAFYTYDRHAASFTSFVERLDLTEMTLVVHDWGGPIGLRFAVEHPERVARLVVLNTDVFAVSDRWPTAGFLRWRAFAEQAGIGLPAGFVVQGATRTKLSPEVVAAYDAPSPHRSRRPARRCSPCWCRWPPATRARRSCSASVRGCERGTSRPWCASARRTRSSPRTWRGRWPPSSPRRVSPRSWTACPLPAGGPGRAPRAADPAVPGRGALRRYTTVPGWTAPSTGTTQNGT